MVATNDCRAWRDGGELPFLIDNIRDLQRLLDFLEQQPFVDATRIGMAGVSLGGMHTWLCAAMDKRVAAAAPLIGVQGFQWAISNNAYHGRVDSLKRAFEMIAKECGKVWQRRSCISLSAFYKMCWTQQVYRFCLVAASETTTRWRRQVCMQEKVDAALVQNAWHRLLPGLLEDFDSAQSLPCIAPRPLFVVNGRDDTRCVRNRKHRLLV